MRIIAGELKGRQLDVPRGADLRPTYDRVRESLFATIESRLEGARVLDLFAGTGSLGIECISRGAAEAVFVERDARVARHLRATLATLGIEDRSRIVRTDAIRFVASGRHDDRGFDIVFADPPYDTDLARRAYDALDHWDGVASGGLVVIEHRVGDRLPERGKRMVLRAVKRYGTIEVELQDVAAEEHAQQAAFQGGHVTKALYPGTFDPITNGHLDLVHRALRLFDEVVVAVGTASDKDPMFTVDERVTMIRAATSELTGITVQPFDGLLVDEVRRTGATAIIRGLRAVSDFEYEFQMALMNRHLAPEVETVFLMPNKNYSYLDSTVVKEVALLGGDASGFVPPVVLEQLLKQRKKSGRA